MDASERVRIRTYVAELLRERDDRGDFTDGDSLIKAGRLDSFAVVKLVMFLESDFAVDFADVEFDPQRFDTVDAIAGIVTESRGA